MQKQLAESLKSSLQNAEVSEEESDGGEGLE